MDNNSTLRDLPFEYRIMAIAPFGAVRAGISNVVTFDAADPEATGKALSAMSPEVTVQLPKEYCPEGVATISIASIDDFTPEKLMQRQPYLAALSEALRIARSAHGDGLAHVEVEAKLQRLLPGLSLDCTPPERNAPTPLKSRGGDAIDELLAMIDLQNGNASNHLQVEDTFTGLQRQLEEVIRQVLRRIVTDPEFRAVESAWRGAALIFEQCQKRSGANPVQLTLASCDASSIAEDLEGLQTLPVHELPNMALLDFPLSSDPRGLAFLETVLDTADRLMLPMATWCGPNFFDLESWTEIDRLSYLPHHIDTARYAQWRRLGKHSGAAWLTLLVNRTEARERHVGTIPDSRISFSEPRQLWLNPPWTYGALVAISVIGTGWPVFAGDARRCMLAKPTLLEANFSEERMTQFPKIGITPLAGGKRDNAVFLTGLFMINGDRQEYHLFLGQLFTFLFRLHNQLNHAGAENDTEKIREALLQFLGRNASAIPGDLDVTLEMNSGTDVNILQIAFTPPKVIINTEKIDLTIRW